LLILIISKSMIKIKDLYQKFKEKVVLNGVSLEINKGEIHFIIGMSGTGKTVLVKHIVGLLKPVKGKVVFEDKEVAALKENELKELRKKITYVFQHSTLFDNLTLYENINLPIIKNKLKTAPDKYIKLVNIEKYKNSYPYEVGESIKKRAAIARGLAMNPDYIIYDEPTTGLSFSEARNIDNLIFEMSRKLNITAIVISHDLYSIMSIADKITMLHNGRIILTGTKEDFKKSDIDTVKQFINSYSADL